MLSVSVSMSPSSLYPLLPHFSIMETLESFTSLLSVMSFELFPYFLFLTSPLFLCSTTFRSFYESCLPPFSSSSSSSLCPLGSRSSLSSHIVSCPHHITQQLVTGNQSPCLASLHGLLLLLLLSPPSSSSPPSSPVTILSSFVCQELLLSEIILLHPSVRPVEGIFSSLHPCL